MGLFQLSLDELRENFVRARFAEAPVFGQSNVEELFDRVHRLRTATDNEPLKKIIDFDAAKGREIEILREYANPTEEPCFGDSALAKTMKKMMSARRGEVEFFQVGKHSVVVVYPDFGRSGDVAVYVSQVEKEQPGPKDPSRLQVYDVSSEYVMEAVWMALKNGYEPARNFILSSAEDKIRAERNKAEADFDSAVAVTADGKKICKAEAVVVFGDERSDDLIFDPACFTTQKILYNKETREPPMHHMFSGHNFYKDVKDFLSRYEHDFGVRGVFYSDRQILVNVYSSGQRSFVLCVPRKDCPDPLPAGGRPIKKV